MVGADVVVELPKRPPGATVVVLPKRLAVAVLVVAGVEPKRPAEGAAGAAV